MIPFTREIESIRKNTTAIPELISTIAEIMNLKANWIKWKKELILLNGVSYLAATRMKHRKPHTPAKKRKYKRHRKEIYIHIHVYLAKALY